MIPRFTSRLASTALVAVFVLVLAGLAVAHRALTTKSDHDVQYSVGMREMLDLLVNAYGDEEPGVRLR